MKLVIGAFVFLSLNSAWALSCPNLSGSYQCTTVLDGQTTLFSKTIVVGIDSEGEYATAITEQGEVKGYLDGRVNKWHGIEWTVVCPSKKLLVQEMTYPNGRKIIGYAMRTHFGYYTTVEENNQEIGYESCQLVTK